MGTIELKEQKNKKQKEYIDLNQYDRVSVLDESDASEVFNTWEEYLVAMEKWKEEWDKEDNL